MNKPVENIFENLPENFKGEIIEEILRNKNFKIERIISNGSSSPENFWYDQDENEFVLLLAGSAGISFNDDTKINLKPGDYTVIEAHRKHRVEWTDPVQKTIWLTFFY